jgi:hypothetical protein
MAVAERTTENQQKDYLCGPFHAARLLRDHGVVVDQDLVALRAGTSCALESEVPPGAAPYRDYRFQFPHADRERAGTSARGLGAAIEELSQGALVCVPLTGEWSAPVVRAVVGLEARLLANLRTGLLWGSRPTAEALLAVLDGRSVAEHPPADWDVGHFVELVQLVRGRRGSLVVVRDSYPELGYHGVHLQPPVAVAAALNRADGRRGGVLAVVEPRGVGAVHALAAEQGLRTEMWDN